MTNTFPKTRNTEPSGSRGHSGLLENSITPSIREHQGQAKEALQRRLTRLDRGHQYLPVIQTTQGG